MRRRAGSVLLCVVLALALTLTACKDDGPSSAALLGYRVGPGDSQITLIYGVRPGDGAGVAEVLAEDTTMVKIRVNYKKSAKKQEDTLQYREVVATLASPLGSRKVIDEAGLVVAPR